MRDRKRMNMDGRRGKEELGGLEERETVTIIYYVINKFIFNSGGKKESTKRSFLSSYKKHI